LRWSPEDASEHETALIRLETTLEALPIFKDYLQAKIAVCQMFAEVDSIISQAAGVPFATNAKRSGCSCGG
jgi:hypothetical protein